jgi:hypothetical protein
MALVELVGSEYNPALEAPTEGGAKPATGVRGRLQAAANRLRGRQAEAPPADEAGEAPKKPRATRKKTTE